MASPIAIARWCRDAGFTGDDRVAAVAVALAASRGEPAAAGGLFGIGTTGDGAAQATAAYAAFRRGGWKTFPAHGSASYWLYYPTASGAVVAVAAEVVAAGAGQAVADATPVDEVAAFAQRGAVTLEFLSTDQAWTRISKVVLGLSLLAVASIALTKAVWLDPFFNFVYRADRKVKQQLQETGTNPQPIIVNVERD